MYGGEGAKKNVCECKILSNLRPSRVRHSPPRRTFRLRRAQSQTQQPFFPLIFGEFSRGCKLAFPPLKHFFFSSPRFYYSFFHALLARWCVYFSLEFFTFQTNKLIQIIIVALLSHPAAGLSCLWFTYRINSIFFCDFFNFQ